MKRPFVRALLPAAVLLWPAAGAFAQYAVQNGTFASGGGIRAGSNFVWDTAGQGAIGAAITGGSYRIETGFWYIAGLSSSVEVAIASFSGSYEDEAVTLSWSFSEAYRCDGVHVYRAMAREDEDAAFERLTRRPLPGEATGYRDETAIPGRTYLYRIGALDDSAEIFSLEISVSLPPKPLALHQNFPNPFNPSTAISYFLPGDAPVNLSIYDVGGHLIRTLVDGREGAGTHTVRWDGSNERGANVGSGVYYYRLITGRASITRKLVLMR